MVSPRLGSQMCELNGSLISSRTWAFLSLLNNCSWCGGLLSSQVPSDYSVGEFQTSHCNLLLPRDVTRKEKRKQPPFQIPFDCSRILYIYMTCFDQLHPPSTSPKKTDSFPSSHQLPIVTQLGWDFMTPSHVQTGTSSDLIMYRSCLCSDSHSECMCTASRLCPENTVSL